MADVYKEYLVKRKKKIVHSLIQVVVVVLGVFLSLLGFSFLGGFLGTIVSVAVIFVGYKLFLRCDREYEYILTNSELDIDVIYSKQARKTIFTLDMKKIDKMVSIKDEKYANDLKRPAKVIDASDGNKIKGTYAILLPEEKGYKKILITPDENFLSLLYKAAPSKVVRLKD